MSDSQGGPITRSDEVLEARLVTAGTHTQPTAPPSITTLPSGELRPTEIMFRIGLLMGAGLFLAEGQGVPWLRSEVVIFGALAMSLLIVMTMALQWRVLGDWRRGSQRLILGCLIIAMVVPISAVISPQLSAMALPETLKTTIADMGDLLGKVPGIAVTLKLLHAIVIFMFYVLVLTVLLATSGPNTRAGFGVIAIALVGVGLFLYPSAETAVGMMLLAFFFRVQWERPLLIPDEVRQHLTPIQLKYLRRLIDHGSLSTGETKLYLDNNPAAFAELVDYRLAQYDSFAREVVPGIRLLHDPACETVEKTFSYARRGMWFLLGIAYLITPDLIPGPIDDFIVMFLCSGAGLNWFNLLFRDRRRTPPA